MLEALILAETLFYLTVSVAIIVIGILCAIVVYHLVKIAKELEAVSKDFHSASSEAGERIREVIDRLSELPILSIFLKHEPKRGRSAAKGREKKDTK